jgi:hypothetical protein
MFRKTSKGEHTQGSERVLVSGNIVLTIDQIKVICARADRNGIEYQVSLIPRYLNHDVSPIKVHPKRKVSRDARHALS